MISCVVACGASKLDRAAPAGEIYTGPYHRSMMRLARSRFPEGEIRILSALYGFIELDRVIEPYEMRWKAPGCLTQDQLDHQAGLLMFAPTVMVLGGQQYADHVARYASVIKPLSGGIGVQMRQAKEMLDG